ADRVALRLARAAQKQRERFPGRHAVDRERLYHARFGAEGAQQVVMDPIAVGDRIERDELIGRRAAHQPLGARLELDEPAQRGVERRRQPGQAQRLGAAAQKIQLGDVYALPRALLEAPDELDEDLRAAL